MSDGQKVSRFAPLHAGALALGCAVGWGAFVMPATTLLPIAGPVGTVAALAIGALLMLIIAANFHCMANRVSNADGLFSFTKRAFGYDHAFLCMWAVVLAYLSVLWANATAFVLMMRYLCGAVLQWGFHYTVAGYDVWAGEVLATLVLIVGFGLVSCKSKRLVRWANTVCALVLFCGVVAVCALVFLRGGFSRADITPGFVTAGLLGTKSHGLQILNIVVLAPWAFVGFEAVSFASNAYRVPAKKLFAIMAGALFCATVIYASLTLLALASVPADVSGWQDYLARLGSFAGIARLPTFYAAQTVLGTGGVVLLGICVIAALSTTMLGLYRSLGRILCAMAEDEVLPSWLGKKNAQQLPQNAIVFVMLISLVIPFLGRTAIGWIVDITTISASIAYIYVSACVVQVARTERSLKKIGCLLCGGAGMAISVVFFFFPLVPNLWSMSSLATESYLILAAWGIAGFALFRIFFLHDKQNRFGKSTVMWISMLFIILFSSVMWTRQTTHDQTEAAIQNISAFHIQIHEERDTPMTERQRETERDFMEAQMETIRDTQLHGSFVQIALIIFALVIMFNIFSMQQQREQKLGMEKIRAEESNKAKTIFLSNMSHDIRTPMNAIIGYTNLARQAGMSAEDIQQFLGKIDSSSKHLLALINDVLEMSRIESGKMELENLPCDLRKLMDGVRDMFATQMATKSILYTVDCYGLKNPQVLCDKNRLNRVLLNLISNAFKFTNENGTVSVALFQHGDATDGTAAYELRVRDTGIGMSPEFAAHVFEAFERERTSTVSGIQGTGLGMAITKSIVDLMGGTIRVQTAQGEGTEFVITLRFSVQDTAGNALGIGAPHEVRSEAAVGARSRSHQSEGMERESAEVRKARPPRAAGTPKETEKTAAEPDFSAMRLLLVDDMDVNRELALMILQMQGFSVETAENGKEAVDAVASHEAGYYNAVLMDIQMPVMDGYEAARQIRGLEDAAKAGVPIIAMTANAFSEDVKKAVEAGMNAHVAKPIDVEVLMKALRECTKTHYNRRDEKE